MSYDMNFSQFKLFVYYTSYTRCVYYKNDVMYLQITDMCDVIDVCKCIFEFY